MKREAQSPKSATSNEGLPFGRSIRNFSSGFTLFELLVVLALMGLLTGIVSVYFAHAFGASSITGCARDISRTIRRARVVAAERGETESVVFDLDSRTYSLEGRRAGTIPVAAAIAIADSSRGRITSGRYSIRLLPSGGVEGGTIFLSEKGKSIGIQMDPVVGTMVVKGAE
jgi:type II secretion system protein H